MEQRGFIFMAREGGGGNRFFNVRDERMGLPEIPACPFHD